MNNDRNASGQAQVFVTSISFNKVARYQSKRLQTKTLPAHDDVNDIYFFPALTAALVTLPAPCLSDLTTATMKSAYVDGEIS